MTDVIKIVDTLLAKHGLRTEGYQPATMEDALYCTDAEVFITLFKIHGGWEVYVGAPGHMERFEVRL